MRRTLAFIIAVGLLAALLAIPGTALARAEFTEYTGTETQIGGPIFGPADWTKPVVQVDFESVFSDQATDDRATGTTYVSGKLTIKDTTTFSGVMRGTSVTVVTGDGYEGTWVGTWQGKLVNGVGFYKAVAHGTGDLAGLKMMFTFTGTEEVNMEGRILDPHGN
jgi:hypothetical protein